jgi:GAF domain-containing protein
LYIQQAITSHLDYQHVLQRIVNEARELTASHRAVVFFLEDDELRAAAIAGEENPKALANYRMPVAGWLIGLAIESGSAVRIDDARHDPHVMADPRRETLVGRTGLQSLLIAPRLTNHRIIGAISLSDKLKGLYDENDEQILVGTTTSLENGFYTGY